MEGFEDFSKENKYKENYGEETAKALRHFTNLDVLCPKSNGTNGFIVCQIQHPEKMQGNIYYINNYQLLMN